MSSALDKLKNAPVSLVKGLGVTLRNMVRTKTTQRYPELMPEPMGRAIAPDADDAFAQPYHLSPRFRGLHGLTRDPETGDHNCIGCMACAKVCPDDLISMDLEKREGHSGRYPVTFTVNIGPCCFCGLCAEVCPTPMRAIVMTDAFEWATFARDGANLVLTREDLERNGDAEVARRRGGRTFDADGALVGILPEEEGNPYFQFAVESDKADRMKKDGDKPEREAKAPREAAPAPPPAADPLAAVRETFAAAGVEPPADLAAFDLESLDGLIADKLLRSKCKAAVIKAQRALGAGHEPAAPAAPAVDPLAAVRDAFAAAGLPVPEDPLAYDPAALDAAVEDRKLRAQCKSALAKARKALGEGHAPAAEPAPAAAPAAEDPLAAPRAAVAAAYAAAGLPVPDDILGVTLDSLDSIDDRKLRGQAKSAVRKLQRALGGEEG